MGGAVRSRPLTMEERVAEEAARRHADAMREVRRQAIVLRRIGQTAQANNMLQRAADPNIRRQIQQHLQREVHREVAGLMNDALGEVGDEDKTITEATENFIKDGLEADD